MQYKKLIHEETIIEFHNNWLGEETVIVNGLVVSKKSSILGTNHSFTVMEDGHHARYILTTRINEGMQVVIDLSRNGELLYNDVLIPYGGKPRNKYKKQGVAKLSKYELDDALSLLQKALKEDPKDAEIFFHMACAYSVREEAKKGFEALKDAKRYGLPNDEMILTHDMLAFLRLQQAFESFVESGFVAYDEKLLKSPFDDQ